MNNIEKATNNKTKKKIFDETCGRYIELTHSSTCHITREFVSHSTRVKDSPNRLSSTRVATFNAMLEEVTWHGKL